MKKLLPGWVVLLILGAFFVAVVAALFFYTQYAQLKGKLNAGATAKADIQKTIDMVSKLMILPSGEVPTIATVADKTKLQAQPFFTAAENGDKVIIYAKGEIAILYRPSINKIVTVAPVKTVASASPTPTKAAAVPSLVLYNGTDKTGITFTVERLITKQYPNVKVLDRLSASKTTYAKTVVIDITEKFSAAAQDIATTLGATLTTLPVGEKKPTADILVIVGKDKAQ